ncbi:MAG: L,D-transpeptidase [Bacteroidia bacterium]|nr:L,D-transpeptidase [Bacteroidia bacterium]
MFGKLFRITACAILLWCEILCTPATKDSNEKPVVIKQTEDLTKPLVNTFSSPIQPVRYALIPRDSFNLSDSLPKAIVCALNRIDDAHLNRADSLVVPDIILDDFLSYSPFPAKCDSLTGIPKCILISYTLQAFAAYENGQLIRWGPVSLGKQSTPTPTGLFYCNWKSRKTISTINPEWTMEWYINIDNRLGVSMHQYDLPGYPASHACVRLLKHDAVFLYRWTDSWQLEDDWNILRYGTPVLIFGSYVLQNSFPWFKNGEMISIGEDELAKEISAYSAELTQRQQPAGDTTVHLP